MPPSPLPAGGAARTRIDLHLPGPAGRRAPARPRSTAAALTGRVRTGSPIRGGASRATRSPSPRRPQGSVQVRPTLTPPPPPPPLPEELVEEVLLRFPPDDPACLVRAALVCRRWRRLICGPRFRRRFREFHRAPPMLGFFVNDLGDSSFFVRTSATCPRVIINGVAVGARHGHDPYR
nr:unnamed protein product [Digitaria exilis]